MSTTHLVLRNVRELATDALEPELKIFAERLTRDEIINEALDVFAYWLKLREEGRLDSIGDFGTDQETPCASSSDIFLSEEAPDIDSLVDQSEPLFMEHLIELMRTNAEAKKICARCPMRDKCLKMAIIQDNDFGVWGGHDASTRISIRNKFRKMKSEFLKGAFPEDCLERIRKSKTYLNA